MVKEKIMEVLKEEARQRIEEIAKNSEKASEELRMRRRAEIREKEDAILEAKKAELERESEKKISKARLAAKFEVLKMKNEMIEEVFAEASKRLAKEKKNMHYGQLLERLVASEGEASNATVVFAKGDEAVVKRLVGKLKKKNNRVVFEEFAGGVRIIMPELRKELDFSFESRLRECRREHMPEISKLLFGGAVDKKA